LTTATAVASAAGRSRDGNIVWRSDPFSETDLTPSEIRALTIES
jgi:hypothetical protein